MPLFNLTTIETYEYTCYYYNVEAESLEEALQLAKDGEVDTDEQKDAEYVGFGSLMSAQEDGESVSQERIDAANSELTAELE